jgi:fatty acid/phospholipid biosynthesis enzyme
VHRTRVPYIHDGKPRYTVLVDAGANVDCEALHMVKATNGFTGNVLLKTMEGTFRFLSRALKDGRPGVKARVQSFSRFARPAHRRRRTAVGSSRTARATQQGVDAAVGLRKV